MANAQRARYDMMHQKLQRLYDDLVIRCAKMREAGEIDWEPLIVSTHRTELEQEDCFKRKTSRLHWPLSPHNQYPSLAIDIQGMRNGELIQGDAAVKICREISVMMFSIASKHGIGIRWGGNFKKVDYPHYELSAEWDAIKRDPVKLMKTARRK